MLVAVNLTAPSIVFDNCNDESILFEANEIVLSDVKIEDNFAIGELYFLDELESFKNEYYNIKKKIETNGIIKNGVYRYIHIKNNEVYAYNEMSSDKMICTDYEHFETFGIKFELNEVLYEKSTLVKIIETEMVIEANYYKETPDGLYDLTRNILYKNLKNVHDLYDDDVAHNFRRIFYFGKSSRYSKEKFLKCKALDEAGLTCEDADTLSKLYEYVDSLSTQEIKDLYQTTKMKKHIDEYSFTCNEMIKRNGEKCYIDDNHIHTLCDFIVKTFNRKPELKGFISEKTNSCILGNFLSHKYATFINEKDFQYLEAFLCALTYINSERYYNGE